jgi:phosphoenolpyruvate carboxylase
MEIPRVMSTQHPDNVTMPFFAHNSVLAGEDEVQEAYYAYSHLGATEQMWDSEGKEVDNFVVEKLLSKYERFFRQKRLGRDVFLTLRVPNPDVERTQAKVLLETLESVSRNFDIAAAFYGEEVAPIFEVILPMTTSARSLNRVYYYYRDFVVGKQDRPFYNSDLKISDWIGAFKPETINVIPLIEDRESMLSAHAIVEEYLKDKKVEYQRVFLARSDPAMNYGLVSSVLLNKIALQNLWNLGEKISVEILPIIGVGSVPFRGNFRPTNIHNCLGEYPSVQTFTTQSAFKFDYPEKIVMDAIEEVNGKKRKHPRFVEVEQSLKIIEKSSKEYEKDVRLLVPLINRIAPLVPARRKRKLHIGLFGYSRNVGEFSLPRAIGFCAALYSVGLPPEILGLKALTGRDLEYLQDTYVKFEEDMKHALRYYNPDVLNILPPALKKRLRLDLFEYEIQEEHRQITSRIIDALRNNRLENLERNIVEAGWERRFLG